MISVIPAHRFRTSRWSGGTTTEMMIWPEGSSYTTGDFFFRISAATVETDTTTFTHLAGVERHLALLSGAMTLFIDGEEVALRPWDTCAFHGEQHVTSSGCASDFNLMVREGRAALESVILAGVLKLTDNDAGHCVCFCPEHTLRITCGKTDAVAEAGMLIHVMPESGEAVTIHGEPGVRLLIARIS